MLSIALLTIKRMIYSPSGYCNDLRLEYNISWQTTIPSDKLLWLEKMYSSSLLGPEIQTISLKSLHLF